jgi:hypothetical protein
MAMSRATICYLYLKSGMRVAELPSWLRQKGWLQFACINATLQVPAAAAAAYQRYV